MVPALAPVMAADTAFYVTFGLFVLALLILAFVTLRWAFRQDRANFAAWRARQRQRSFPTSTPTSTPDPTPDPPAAEGDGPPHPGP